MNWRDELREYLAACVSTRSFTSYNEYKEAQIRKFEIENELDKERRPKPC